MADGRLIRDMSLSLEARLAVAHQAGPVACPAEPSVMRIYTPSAGGESDGAALNPVRPAAALRGERLGGEGRART